MTYWIVALLIAALLCALRAAIDSFRFKVEDVTIPYPSDTPHDTSHLHESENAHGLSSASESNDFNHQGDLDSPSSPDPNAPPAPHTQKPLRLLFLSDLHLRDCLISQERVIDAVRDQPCDLILFGGDLDREIWPDALSWLQTLRQALSEAWARPDLPPVIGVWGNHDGIVPRTEGRRPGLHFLENEAFHYQDGDVLWEILGLGDLTTSTLDPDAALAHGRATAPAPVDPRHRLILVHNPDAISYGLPESRLILAGHYHDGQIRLPWRLEFKLLRRDDRLARQGIITGLHHIDGQTLLISPGIGNTFIPLRFFSQAGVHIVELEAGPRGESL